VTVPSQIGRAVRKIPKRESSEMPPDFQKYLCTQFFDQLVGRHRAWLKDFNTIHLKAWDDLFTKDNSEAALCEAGTRQLLEELDVSVEPCSFGGNDPNPDFKCRRYGKVFYVDATCVMKDTATKRSQLDDVPHKQKASYYSLLTETYFRKADKKESHFKNLNAPCMIAIGTLHFQASARCFDKKSAEEILTGKSGLRIRINKRIARLFVEPYNSTSLESAPFLKVRRIICSGPVILPVRQTISGVLLCPFGTQPIKCLGLLHPEPLYEFDRDLLPGIEFCHLKAGWAGGAFITEWI